MPIDGISRLVSEIAVSTTYHLTDPNINLIVADATSSGFTITLWNDSDSGTFHEVTVKISDSDVSGNTVTIVDSVAAFSTTLAATSASAIIRTDGDGDWYVAATFPTEDAAAALSAADSAGLRGSSATSGVASNSINVSTGNSVAASATLSGVSGTASTATSQNGSQSLNISTTGSVAASAVLSGTSATASVAGSATLSGVSATASVATSQNGSQSLNVSTALSTAVSSN